MSALPPKADIVRHGGNVRFVPNSGLMHCSNPIRQLVCTGKSPHCESDGLDSDGGAQTSLAGIDTGHAGGGWYEPLASFIKS